MNTRLLFLPLLASAVLGQSSDATRGPFSSMPFAANLARTSGLDEILFKLSGDQTTAPLPMQFNLAPLPDYRMSAMFASLPPAVLAVMDIDAFSSGNDRLIYDSTGTIIGNIEGGWTQMEVSVTATAVGVGGPISDRKLQGKNVGGDLYSYVFPDSEGVEDSLLGQPMLEIPSEAFNLTSQDLQAGDAMIPQILIAMGTPTPLTPVVNEFYFSLTNESAASMTAAQAGSVTYSGATIYRIVWNGSVWSTMMPAFTSNDLGLTPGEDIDALAVYARSAGSNLPHVVISTKMVTPPVRNQILAVLPSGLPSGAIFTLLPLRRNGGQLVTDALKLHLSDDVDVLCGTDPDRGVFNDVLGTACDGDGPTPPSEKLLGISIARDIDNHCVPQPSYTVHITGWGNAVPDPNTVGIVGLYGVVPGGVPFLIGPYARTDTQGTLSLSIQIPPTLGSGILGIAATWQSDIGKTASSYWSVLKL